jgi:hypothetical protein
VRTANRRTGLIPLSVCAVLMLAACGSDESVSSPTDPTLQAPVAVNVVSSGGDADGDAALGRSSLNESAVATDMSTGLMPAFGGYVFEVGEGLPALPTDSTGYHYPAGVGVDATEVARIADALGVAGNPEAAAPDSGNQWRVGPEDGSAPALFVSSDSQISWYYSNAWATVEVAGCGVSGSVGAPTEVVSSVDVEGTTEATVEANIENGVGADGQVPTSAVEADQRPAIEECPTPEPPEGVPTADEAAALANELLTALGEDPAAFEFETFADEWSASVAAFPTVDGVRWPTSFSFVFGGQSALQWANGTLAEPVGTGPYPLVDLETAIARLEEQNGMWGYGGGRDVLAVDAGAADAAATDDVGQDRTPTSDVQTLPVPIDGSTPPTPEPTPPIPEPVVITLVDVDADLWPVWDADNTVWLLPAYKFTDTEGTDFTVPAITDEYMIVVEPTIEPQPVPAEPIDPVVVDPPTSDPATSGVSAPADPAVLDEFVGVPLPEFEEVAKRYGFTTRVARQDGVDLAVTMDYSDSRVNVAVKDDIVTEILSFG